MKKYIKRIGMIILIFLVLCIVVVISIAAFVSPNRLKPLLTAQVMKYTGRQLIIDGDLSWTFFPVLGVKTGHMSLGNPPGFSMPLLAEIQSANISVRLFPLLHNKIESHGITLHGLTLFLIKNAKGEANWNFSQATLPKKINAKTVETPHITLPVSTLGLSVAGIDVTDGQIKWINEETKQAVTINPFELHANHISFLQPFPMTMRFILVSQQPNKTGEIKVNTQISINMIKQIFSFRPLEILANIHKDNKKMDIYLKGDVMVDLLKQTLQSSVFHAAIGNLNLTGKMSMTELMTQPNVTGQVDIAPFDLRTWLATIGSDVSSIQMLNVLKGHFDIESNTHMVIHGRLDMDPVEVNHIKLTNVSVPMEYQNNILYITPVTAHFYQGTLQTNIMINLQTALPQLTWDGNLSNVQIGPLLDDLGGTKKKLKLNGTTLLDYHFTTVGFDKTSILNHLNGDSHFTVTNGTLEGVDIRYYIDLAKSILAQRSPTAPNTYKTEFANLTGTANIKNGLIQNNDLVVTASMFTSKGNGNINLVSEQMNYRIDTQINSTAITEGNSWADLAKIPISITVIGNLNDPHIQLDVNAITQALANQFFQKKKDSIKQQIEKRIGNGGILFRNF